MLSKSQPLLLGKHGRKIKKRLCLFYVCEGGIPGKSKGRISDAPMVGCGGYANEFGAATTSGHGESLMKMTLARGVVFNMEKLGQNAQVRY